ncbi:MAG TPA: F0F1 ATP synthase subunit A [Longimicrobiaceae bacterium]|nr:F0F1 ATP synthase subunit A [Longimicrobiaceae bacterium]
MFSESVKGMFRIIPLLLLLVAAPQVSAQEVPDESHAEAAPAAGEHGEEEEHQVDFIHHVSDAREWATPLGTVHLPAEGSWMLGPLDITPTKYVLFLWFAAILVLAVFIPAAQGAKRRHTGDQPRGGHNAIEALVLFFRNQVVMPNVGHDGAKFVPFVLTLFFFILTANLLGLLPWGASPTASISVTGGLALLSFCVIEIAGMRALGVKGYLGTIFFVPPGMNRIGGGALAIFMAPIELLGKFTKPFALAIRLMANMIAGHVVLLALLSLIFVFGSFFVAALPVLMAMAITFLEIFVAFLQAYIFALLTSVFIGLITAH